MEEVKLKLDEGAQGVFYIEEDSEQIAEMIIQLSGNHMIIMHTEQAQFKRNPHDYLDIME